MQDKRFRDFWAAREVVMDILSNRPRLAQKHPLVSNGLRQQSSKNGN